MSIGQFVSILLARWRVALSILLVTVAATLLVTLVLPKTYTGSSSVMVQLASPDPIAGVAYAITLAPQVMATQVDILNSDRVAQNVVRTLKLNENPEMRAAWQDATQGRGSFEAWYGGLLKLNLEVLTTQSNVIIVNYKAKDAKASAVMANGFVQAYLDTALEMRVDPARRSSGFFEARAKELRESVETAQAKLSTYQRENGIIATDERLDIETARLNELSSQLVAVQMLAAESSSRQGQAAVSSDRMQDVLTNGLLAQIKADMSRQEARLAELTSRLGDANPQVREARAALAGTRARLDSETGRVIGGVGVSNKINASREAEIRAALDGQRNRVIKLREQRDGMSSLVRDVENAQKSYDAVLARLNTTTMESQATLTNLSVLTTATEPADPSSPKLGLNIGIAVFVGMMLAVGAALVLELANRRVRTVDDVLQVLDLPVLGILPRPDKRRMFSKVLATPMQRRLLGYTGTEASKAT
jgi:polysaccharide biosynthesis transport protein